MNPILLLFKMLEFFLIIHLSTKHITPEPREWDIKDVVEKDGYPFETHFVTTEDGYILGNHRIPYGKQNFTSGLKNRKPVLLLPGIFTSSSGFLLLGPTDSLGYMLANEGYDVWLLNYRGIIYSKNHTKNSPTQAEFWRFSFNEYGIYDVSATVDYILKTTGHKTIELVGYSMGTTAAFIFLTERPEYQNKIISFTAMAPAVFIKNNRLALKIIDQSLANEILKTSLRYTLLEFPSSTFGLKHMFSKLCTPNGITDGICDLILLVGGRGLRRNIDRYAFQEFFKFYPESISLRTIAHYDQFRKTGEFEKFDFGKERNLREYGSTKPSGYNLSKITVPINVIYSTYDDVIVIETGLKKPVIFFGESKRKYSNKFNLKKITYISDTKRVIKSLKTVQQVYEIPIKSFTHSDYIWSYLAPKYVYTVVLQMLNKNNLQINEIL